MNPGPFPHLPSRLFAGFLLFASLTCQARIGVECQMPLGNPSNATADTNNHEHYLVQRRVFAMDYDDKNGEPNWVSWDLSATDMGPAKRSPTFKSDNDLPSGFHHITSADYKGSGFDRGHMCPSADRTDNDADNRAVFVMSNIIPQTPDNNEGVWEHLEAYCRTLAQAGNELLIICGPTGFNGKHINNNGPVLLPEYNWKIVVVVPEGSGSVLNRITAATRVIAVDIPNEPGIRKDAWTKYLVSVNQLEALTGFNFFRALPPNVARILKAKIDGHSMPTLATLGEKVSFNATAQELQQANANPAPTLVNGALAIVVLLLIVCMAAFVMFLRIRTKR